MTAQPIGPPVDPAPSAVGPVGAVSPVPSIGGPRQGRYAGIVSRTVSVLTDAVVLALVSIVTLFVLQALLAMIEGKPFGDVTIDSEWGIVIVAFQAALYFTVGWAVFGRTGGEALFGLRMVRRNGQPVGWVRSFVRFLVWPLAFAACFLGFLWILIDRRRRSWPDLIAGTVVIYDWRRADAAPVDLVGPHP